MPQLTSNERRNTPRILASRDITKVDVLDKLGRTIASLDDAAILDVSAGGLALCSRFGVSEGLVLRICPTARNAPSFEVRVLSNLPLPSDENLFKLRCKLTLGVIPSVLVR